MPFLYFLPVASDPVWTFICQTDGLTFNSGVFWPNCVFKLTKICSFVLSICMFFLSGSALKSQGHCAVKTTAEYNNRISANHEKCIYSVVINKSLAHHEAQLYIPAPFKVFSNCVFLM